MTVTDNSSQKTSPSLLARAKDGDAQAWHRLVQLYGPLVYAWARRTGLQPQDAADATQETFAAVATSLSKYDASRVGATFRGWLWTIVRNKAADVVRGRKQDGFARGGSTNLARLQAIDDASRDSAEPPHQNGAGADIVRCALAVMRTNFEPTTWQAFWRTVIDGCTPDEVAAELNLTRWAVYKARSRVLHCLRTELAGLETID